jgi:hypothetical protein
LFRKSAEIPEVADDDTVFARVAPFRLEPKFVTRIWGSRDLRPWFDRVADADPLGEVWLTGDDCLVATGSHAGKTLGKLFHDAPRAMLGEGAPSADSPLLIKVIFAREKLSVQVHLTTCSRKSTASLAAKPSAGTRWPPNRARKWLPD